MVYCCVGECIKSTWSRGAKATIAQKGTSDKRQFLRFYRFPCIDQDRERCKTWIARVNRRKQDLKLRTTKVCSEHFSDKDFVYGDFLKASLNYTTGLHIKLKNDAVPNSPVPRLSFATRFDTKLREKSFEKQNSAKAVLFTMYVSTVWYGGQKTFYQRKTWVRIIMKLLTFASRLKLLSRSFWSNQNCYSAWRNIFKFHFRSQKCEQICEQIWLQNWAVELQGNPAVPRLSFATRFAHIFAHIFATGNEFQKYFSARSNSFDLTENSVKAVLTWTRTWAISLWCALMFFVDKMSSRLPYQTVETYIGNKTAFAEFCFSKLFGTGLLY